MHGSRRGRESSRRSAGRLRRRLGLIVALLAGALAAWRHGGRAAAAPPSLRAYADGHARPRALAVDARGQLLYVAGSTADRLYVVDLRAARPRLAAALRVCAFPDALAALPRGGVVVSCRFDPALRVVTPAGVPARRGAAAPSRDAKPEFDVRAVTTGPEHGNRGLALDPAGRFAYVGSPPSGGVKIVDLQAPAAGPQGDAPAVRVAPTGLSPQVLRFVPAAPAQGRPAPLLLVSNFVGHTVVVLPVNPDGGLGPALQTIQTAAPVLDLALLPPAGDPETRGGLLLATHEDRALSRAHLAVEGLDSVLLLLPAAGPGAPRPFADAGPGRRIALNLSERAHAPVVEPDAVAIDAATGRIAVVGAGSDDVVWGRAPRELVDAPAATVGTNPSAVAFLPSGGLVTADRLGDTLSFVDAAAGGPTVTATLAIGEPARPSPAERGEVMFYSRALVPHNVATGPLSIYTCAACHADGAIDGRRHPSKRNRFYSMTKTCRGLLGTEPFLSLGQPDTFAAFADNIVATHAQGALDAPDSYDRYPVTLRLRQAGRYADVTLSPEQVRAALAAYLRRIPVEPSPFVAPGRRALAPDERRGLALFRDRCAGCHQLLPSTASTRPPPAGALEQLLLDGRLVLTSARRYDVGTPVLGEGGNNPPSLRGVWAAAPYFSDGSAPTLDDVLRRTDPARDAVHAPDNARRPPAFSAAQRADLRAFLRAL